MDETTKALAPEVRSILRAAAGRTSTNRRLSVDARSFDAAIERAVTKGRTPVIAEIKPTSPTTEDVRIADPVELATAMVGGGATAISVLTEPEYFDGSTAALERVRDAVSVPVLRKDFIVAEEQLDAVAADMVLLIVRFVDDIESLIEAARARGMEPLVEVHTGTELQTAIDAGATIIGINNRDLTTLDVDLGTVERLAPSVPDGVTLVAESGIGNPTDARRMTAAGADALLVGSAIMDGDPRRTTQELVTA